MSAENSEAVDQPSSRAAVVAAAAVASLLALYWTHGIPRSPSLGWDEAMHADLPALRMLYALKRGEVRGAFDTLLGCSQYPFVYPSFLAAVQAVFGVGEAVCRAAATVLWCATLFGLFLVGREVSPKGSLAPWLSMAFGALSPMALAFAGTLFLEIPFVCASVFALRAWLRRSSHPGRRSEITAGAWIAVCLFTKFNYGFLLAFGFALDWLFETIAACRSGEGAACARRTGALLLIPAVALLWWFGFDAGHEHRRQLIAYLAGNRGFDPVPYATRLLHASAWLSLTPRLFVVVIVSAAATLPLVARPPLRAIWLVFAALAGPILAHPFHLERFLIPIAIPLWALAGIGLARILPRRPVLRPAILGVLLVLSVVYPSRAAVRTADLLGALSQDARVRSYQADVYASRPDLSASRPLPTNGLDRDESERFLSIVAREIGPTDRIGWIGVSSSFSPAAIHIGLLENGGSVDRFLRDAAEPMDVAYFGEDPHWSDAELAAYAARFDIIFATEPPDLKNLPGRRWTRVYREHLVDRLGWDGQVVGSASVSRPLQDVQVVSVYACRPKR
jgi:nitrate reductase NapE component